MREIKFRAWDEKNKFMVYSDKVYPFGNYNFEFDCLDNMKFNLMKMIGRDEVSYVKREFNEELMNIVGADTFLLPDWHRVENAPIMQWTNDKDKFGRYIYEGDIIRGLCLFYGDEVIGEVYFSDRLEYQIKTKNTRKEYLRLLYDIEVLGNVYENPDLVKWER